MTGQTGDEQQQRKGSADPHLSDSKNVHFTLYKLWPGGTAASTSTAPPSGKQFSGAVDELGPYL
jgi:hypothetical protein